MLLIENNQITGSIPTEFANLEKLEKLDLGMYFFFLRVCLAKWCPYILSTGAHTILKTNIGENCCDIKQMVIASPEFYLQN